VNADTACACKHHLLQRWAVVRQNNLPFLVILHRGVLQALKTYSTFNGCDLILRLACPFGRLTTAWNGAYRVHRTG